VWRVYKDQTPIGILATTRDGFPKPLGFYPDVTERSVFYAGILAGRGAWAATGPVPLASIPHKRRINWRLLIGLTLIPIDTLGRRINRPGQTFVCGRYFQDRHFGLGTSIADDYLALKFVRPRHPKASKIPLNTPFFGSGTSSKKIPPKASFHAPKLGSKSEKAVTSAAA
jgi:hypothetical protein